MEEIEVPTEHLHEAVHHEAHHSQEGWITGVALSTALLAALAAVTALLSGMNANEALIDRVTSSDSWSEFQANSVKLAILEADADLIKLNGQKVPSRFSDKMKKYRDEKDRLSKKATEEEESYRQRLDRHENLARGVTMFQIAISIAAIAALTKRRWFWYMGLGFGVIGTGFLIYAMAIMKVTEVSEGSGEQEQKEPKAKGGESKDGKLPGESKEGKSPAEASKTPADSKEAKGVKDPKEAKAASESKQERDAKKANESGAFNTGSQADRLTKCLLQLRAATQDLAGTAVPQCRQPTIPGHQPVIPRPLLPVPCAFAFLAA